MILFITAVPPVQIGQQQQGPSHGSVNEKSSSQAARFISILNSRDEKALVELLAADFKWSGGDQFGGVDSFVNIYKRVWKDLKNWRISSTGVADAFIVDGLLQDTPPGKNAKMVIPLIRLDATEEYMNPYTKDGSPIVTNNYSIYLAFQNNQLVRVIGGPSSETH